MSNELLTILNYIEQERGISRESIVNALETAILNAARKSLTATNLRVEIDPRSGKIQVIAQLEVVEKKENGDQLEIAEALKKYPDVAIGDVIDWEVTPDDLGRIAAQTARQAIQNQLKQAERDTVHMEFADRIGQIIYGTVRRFDGGNIIIDFQKADGIMQNRDKIHDEQYAVGDRINALLVKVDTKTSGPCLIVSRSNTEFVAKLFEREVSEIKDGIVEIVGIAREAGKRTKIAVKSNDKRIDPVGACVGVRGTRVKRITEELGSERIDIIPYSDDIATYAANALLPAKISSVDVNDEKHELTVYVSDDQSKQAFGRKAQNIRLCARLIGWNITIRHLENQSEPNSIAEQVKLAAQKLANDINVSYETAELLVSNGFVTIDGIKAADKETLLSIADINVEELTAALAGLE